MEILNSTLDDLPEIFRLYNLATEYQKAKFPENQWPEFDPDFIKTEILENRQFKIIMQHKIACIWAFTFNDVEIWQEKENNDAVYIHRIATNPEFRGNNFVQKITEWSTAYAKKRGKRYLRMDTCGDNKILINHYEKCGFQFLEMKRLNNAPNLQQHYQNADVCFFEIDLHRTK